MELSKLHFMIILLLPILLAHPFPINNNNNKTYLFREYIGAEFTNVKFSDVPINPGVQFHFILSFAIDYKTTLTSPPTPTNGNFSVYWDTDNLGPDQVIAIKRAHPNVKVAVSLGGDTVENSSVYFTPSSVHSWVDNAVISLTRIIKKYHLDGIDIDYEHFNANDTGTFVECIGKLIMTLKGRKVISFASIAPYADEEIQTRYVALWRDYGKVIDYVNFQFYAYDEGSSVKQFLGYFREQRRNYRDGKMLASFISGGSGGWAPNNTGFYKACEGLKEKGDLYGIFVWCADESKAFEFKYEKMYQKLLACY